MAECYNAIPISCVDAIVLDDIESFEDLMFDALVSMRRSSVSNDERVHLEMNNLLTLKYIGQIETKWNIIYAVTERPNFLAICPIILPYCFVTTTLSDFCTIDPISIGSVGQKIQFGLIKYVKINNCNLEFMRSTDNMIVTLACKIRRGKFMPGQSNFDNKLIICIDDVIYHVPVQHIHSSKIKKNLLCPKERDQFNTQAIFVGRNQSITKNYS
uniref:Uncharacterized protein n=1 Tax=viral metagenome TaxID=1070528 RepID=A0A6C0C8C1_9ZZZZ